MRIAGLCGLGLVALSTSSFAADMPVLRGSQGLFPGEPVYFRWQGAYLGGHGSYSSSDANFSQGTGDLIGYILRNTTLESEAMVSTWSTLPSHNGATSAGWGGFVGYNAQWDDAVLGLELNYTRMDMNASAADTLARLVGPLSDGYTYGVHLNSSTAINLTDLGTLRLRGGWAASWFMPYGFIGVAIGRADVVRSATVTGSYTDGTTTVDFGPTTQADSRNGAWSFGYTAGAGIDVALMANFFMRAEYEFVRFGDFNGVTLSVNTVRAGLGAKF